MTNVSKYRHVRRAISRSAAACTTVSGTVGPVSCGKLISRATPGAASQTRPNGNSNGAKVGLTSQATSQTPKPSTTPGAMRRYCPSTDGSAPPPDRAAVTHSNKCRRDTASRHTVRITASSMFAAVSASNSSESAIWLTAITASVPNAAKWLRSVTPDRSGTMPNGRGSKRGSASISTTTRVQTVATAGGISQPAKSVVIASGANKDRRKLSIIFQRPTTGMPPLRRCAPKIHGSNCQSPRAQR